MDFFGGLVIGRLCFFHRSKAAQIVAHAIGDDSGNVSICSGVFVDPLNLKGVVRLSRAIHPILGVGRNAQIFPSIVVSNHIDVVDLMCRPIARHQRPCYSVGILGHAINIDGSISGELSSPSHITFLEANTFTLARSPSNYASGGIV